SSHPAWKAGDAVICNGWGMGETHLGGYAEKARVKGDWLVRLPAGMSARDAMAIGTAGYTAMLSVLALEKHGLTPAHGPVAVAGCGLAAGMDLPSFVAPFILRGISLLGIDSVMCPLELRKRAWNRLAADLDRAKLAEITQEIGLDEVVAAGSNVLAGKVRGR